VSPILLRPVREQLEHDRVIRLLQARWKRRYQVGINPGAETNAAIGSGDATTYPDVVLTTPGSRRPEIVIEVETGESVNRMEALFEWARLAKERSAFHLFVPSGSVEVARRLCQENSIRVSEIWTFHQIGDQTRFTQAFRAPAAPHARRQAEPRSGADSAGKRKAAVKPKSARARPAKVTRPAKNAKPAKVTRPASSSKKAAKPARRKTRT
jgi:hypothetical protein